jgi:hypothetical protein
VPGDRTTDIAWLAAELLASQSGKPTAFVEDGANEQVRSSVANGLVTRIGWYASDVENDRRPASVAEPQKTSKPILGERVSDLFGSFSFVIVNAMAPAAEDLVPLAREVDGVVIVVRENATSVEAAQSLLASLRGASATLVGTVFVADRSDYAGPTIFDLKS